MHRRAAGRVGLEPRQGSASMYSLFYDIKQAYDSVQAT